VEVGHVRVIDNISSGEYIYTTNKSPRALGALQNQAGIFTEIARLYINLTRGLEGSKDIMSDTFSVPSEEVEIPFSILDTDLYKVTQVASNSST
jgi:hypothetical protein